MSSQTMAASPGRDDYKVAILCALGAESEAVEALFDEIYETDTLLWVKADGDRNTYTTGKIGRHYVVLAYLPGIGKVNAAASAGGIRVTFRNITLALVVGICGGAPTTFADENIYLGDVIISTRLLQGDFGRELVDGFVMKELIEGNLGPASQAIQSFLHKLQSRNLRSTLQEKTLAYIEPLVSAVEIEIPSSSSDILFPAAYIHKHHHTLKKFQCTICQNSEEAVCLQSQKMNCTQLGCGIGTDHRVRNRNTTDGPSIFFGPICSSDAVKKNGVARDEFVQKYQVIAFEMEGAGVWDTLPTIVVKAVCDYADSHKSKKWQAYAAICAAASSKAILEQWGATDDISKQAQAEIWKSRSENAANSRERKERYLASLDFEQLDARLFNIKLAHPRTCKWIFATAEFESWLDPDQSLQHNRILWIKGKPGSGKSTLMKHVQQASQDHLPQHRKLSFFFHARGSELQKTRTGMMRSLAFQALKNDPKLMDKFMDIFPSYSGQIIEQRQWSHEALEHFFLLCTQKGWLGNTVLYIDALDECELTDARALAAFCEDLAVNALHQDISLFICISMRYFPNIGMKKCIQLHLDERHEHESDIQLYITDKFRVQDEEDLEKMILTKAKHVFLWAVLVVHSLNTEYDNGVSGAALLTHLMSIPGELHSVFSRLLGPAEALPEETPILLQLVLYSYRPLSLDDLFWIVRASTRSRDNHPVETRWTTTGMKKYIVHASRGLLEIADNSVQFIHETVRHYLLQPQDNDGPNANKLILAHHLCHENIAKACLDYMALVSSASAKDYQDLSYLQSKYAEDHILRHISEVEDSSRTIELLRIYSKHFRGPVDSDLDERIDQGDDLLCSIIQRYQPPPQESFDGPRILRLVLDDADTMAMNKTDSLKKLYEDALLMAIDKGWTVAIDMLLIRGAYVRTISADKGNDTKHMSFRRYPLQLAIDFLERPPNHSFGSRERAKQERQKYETISILLIRAIRSLGGDVNVDPHMSLAPLAVACKMGSRNLINCLLDAGADPNMTSYRYPSPLWTAITEHRNDLAALLLAKGASPHGLGSDLYNPNPHGFGIELCSPLAMAVRLNNLPLTKMLLEHGADANGQFSQYQSIIKVAKRHGFRDIIKCLREHGAKLPTNTDSSSDSSVSH